MSLPPVPEPGVPAGSADAARRSNDPAERLLAMVEDGGGPPELIQAVQAVVADQRLVERELDRLTTRNVELTLALDSARVATWIWRTGGTAPELESEHGVARVSGLGTWDGRFESLLRAVIPADRDAVRDALRMGTTSEVEFQMKGADGEMRWLVSRGQPWPPDAERPTFIAGTLEDITDRRRLQAQVRDAEAKYRMLVEQLPAIVYIVTLEQDGSGRTTYVSPRVESILGYTQEEWLADSDLWWKIVEESHRDRVKAEIDRKDRDHSGGQRITQVYPVRAKDGHRVWLRNESTTEWDPTGRIRFTDGVMIDITERVTN